MTRPLGLALCSLLVFLFAHEVASSPKATRGISASGCRHKCGVNAKDYCDGRGEYGKLDPETPSFRGVQCAKDWLGIKDPNNCWWVCFCKCQGGGTVSASRRRSQVDFINRIRRDATSTPTTYEISTSITESFLASSLHRDMEVQSGTFKFIGMERMEAEQLEFPHYGLLNDTLVIALDSFDSALTLASPADIVNGLDVPLYEVLVAVPDNWTAFDLIDYGNRDLKIVAAPMAEEESTSAGYRLHKLLVVFNIYGILNYNIVDQVGTIVVDPDQGTMDMDLLDITERDLIDKRRRAAVEGDFVIKIESFLNQAQMEYASYSSAMGFSAVSSSAGTGAAAGGVSAGVIVGAVLGSVGGLIVLSAAAVGVVVVGRTLAVRTKMSTSPASEMELGSSSDRIQQTDSEEMELDETQAQRPKFSVQVMGNTQVAGSLTMRNPQMQDA